MCFFGGTPQMPAVPAAPTPQSTAREQEAAVTSALARERAARRAAAGRSASILTSPMGSPMPMNPAGSKTMLGG